MIPVSGKVARTCRACSALLLPTFVKFVVVCVDRQEVVGWYCAHNSRCLPASEPHVLDAPGERFNVGIIFPSPDAARRN